MFSFLLADSGKAFVLMHVGAMQPLDCTHRVGVGQDLQSLVDFMSHEPAAKRCKLQDFVR
jgi:hypothetical protein